MLVPDLSPIHFNTFDTIKDNRVKPRNTNWEELIALFTAGHACFPEKHQAPFFNLATYQTPETIDDKVTNTTRDHKNGKVYTRRKQANLIHNPVLVLDYDEQVTLEEVLERFKHQELIYYTSHRHLYDGLTHKFRILLPFHKPLTTPKVSMDSESSDIGDWYRITDALKGLAGPGCDPKSFDPNQIYEMPSAPEERQVLARSGYQKGFRINWEEFEPNTLQPSNDASAWGYTRAIAGFDMLEPDQMLITERGPIRVKDVVGKIDGVKCPFPRHGTDKRGSEFVRKVEETGNIFLYCKKCACKYYMRREEHDRWYSPPSKAAQKKKQQAEKEEIADSFAEFNVLYADGQDRRLVNDQLEEIRKSIASDDGWKFVAPDKKTGVKQAKNYRSYIVYMPEGSGKSRLVLELARDKHRIIFACKSWAQAESKFEEFSAFAERHKFAVEIVRSKDAKARRRFNTKLVRNSAKYPYESGAILDDESIDAFIKNNPDLSEDFIRVSWQFFKADKFFFDHIPYNDEDDIPENAYNWQLLELLGNEYIEISADFGAETNSDKPKPVRIIITTFEQLRIHRLKKVLIPEDWIIWFDDPDIADVIDIEPYDTDRWQEVPDDEIEDRTRKINGRRYFRRDVKQSLGDNLKNHKCIYTTTEFLTKRAIELMMQRRGEERIIHDKMTNVAGGTITVLGTTKVRRKYDGLIPVITRRLYKMGFPLTLIANGLSTRWNHSNNKGNNELSKSGLLIELSIPHDAEISTICDALDYNFRKDRNTVRKRLMLDRLHQAIGRNSGYRYQGSECIALVDRQFHRQIMEAIRYKVDEKNSVLIDRTARMSRLQCRTKNDASQLVKEIESILNNISSYVCDFRKSKPDIKVVLEDIEDIQKRQEFVIRLLVSLCNHAGIDLQQPPENESYNQTKYRELSEWIIKNWVDEAELEEVLEAITSMTQ